ncbi:MAG: MBL fold metallo-hydrolase [Cyclobacteriaceae bacterium]
MKTTLSVSLFLMIVSLAAQERATADRIATSSGDLVIQPILHGTVALSWNGQTIYVDPYGGAEAFAGIEDPNIILITDIHGDHLNMKTLQAVNTSNAKLFVPQAVFDKLDDPMKSQAVVIANGGSSSYEGIDISAIPMYNMPDDETSRHRKGRGNGYVLTMGGKRVYLSGDTEDIPEMRSLTNIDVAFVCMNLPYTMDIKQASSAVAEFKPAIVYPYHYRGSGGLSDVEGFMLLVNAAAPQVEVRLKDWYPED